MRLAVLPLLLFPLSAQPHFAVLKRGPIEAVIVDNTAIDDPALPNHRPGYSGLAAIRNRANPRSPFVPAYAGLNFEHILDGTLPPDRQAQFEPRNHPIELRRLNAHTVELYQSPTFLHALESRQRFELLPDGVLELTIDVTPTQPSFPHGYINLFWASYIDKPESLDIHFPGPQGWIRGVTPAHGMDATHTSLTDSRQFPHVEPYPLTLVHNLSRHKYKEPWFFGITRGMAFVQMFRPADQVRISQSPSGGGTGNPAWDFQYFIQNYQPCQTYRFVMRAAWLPYQSHEQVEKATRKHRRALARSRK